MVKIIGEFSVSGLVKREYAVEVSASSALIADDICSWSTLVYK